MSCLDEPLCHCTASLNEMGPQRANTLKVALGNDNGEIYSLSLLCSLYQCEYRISSAHVGWMWNLPCIVEGKIGFLY